MKIIMMDLLVIAVAAVIPLSMKAQSSSLTEMDELKALQKLLEDQQAQTKAQQKLLEEQQAQIQTLQSALAKQQKMLVEAVHTGPNPTPLVPAVDRSVDVEVQTDGVQAPQDQATRPDRQPLKVQEEVRRAPETQDATAPNPDPQQVITCTSKDGERQVCKADTKAGVAFLQSTGSSNCLLGKSWGYDDAGVWVSNGCGGEFAVGATKEASGASKFVGNFELYGQLRVLTAAYNDKLRCKTTPRA